MRSPILLFLFLADITFSASIPSNLSKRQSAFDDFIQALGTGGKVPHPANHAPLRVDLPSPNKLPGVKRVKIRSGPYQVISMNKKSLSGHRGMLENYPDTHIEKPCQTDECTILWQQAGLEYPDGSNANIDTGMWLHHMVHFNTGPGRWDATGFGKTCLPHLAMGLGPSKSERFFTSGNERTVFDFNPDGKNMSYGTGYHITRNDTFGYLNELMNMNTEDKIVYMTMYYDYLEGPLPKGWNEIKPIWIDVAGCVTSEVKPPKQNGTYTITSKPWKPNFEGKIMGGMTHLHDGGMSLEVLTTPNHTLCTGTATYSESADYVYKMYGMDMGPDKVAKDHISSMRGCEKRVIKSDQMTKDQAWWLKGYYDYDKKEGNLEKGKQSEIMVLSVFLVAVPPGPVPKPA